MSVSTGIFFFMFFFQANFTNKMGSGWISVKEADARRCVFSTNFGPYFGLFLWKWIDIKRLTFFDNSFVLGLSQTVTDSHNCDWGSQSCVFKSVLVDGYAQSWSQGIFWTVELTKACCFVFSNWKKVQQKGLKLKKLLGSFMTRILRFSFIYAWYFDLCASVKMMKRNNKLGVFELFPVRNWIKKSGRGGSKSGLWVFFSHFHEFLFAKSQLKLRKSVLLLFVGRFQNLSKWSKYVQKEI